MGAEKLFVHREICFKKVVILRTIQNGSAMPLTCTSISNIVLNKTNLMIKPYQNSAGMKKNLVHALIIK